MTTSALLSPAQLQEMTPHGNVRILDATYGVPDFPRGAVAGMERTRIGNAVFFDIDDIADADAPCPHTLPDEKIFAQKAGELGIGNNDTIVIYDQNGLSFAAARAWWMFRVFGHDKVYVLNGGLPAWLRAGLPVVTGVAAAPAPTVFTTHFRPELYRSFAQMEQGDDTVLDARSTPRFEATVHTMDGDSVPAHIPGSCNLPYQDFLDERGAMKGTDMILPPLMPYLEAENLVATCGSGVTACVLALALHEAGRKDVAVYDGSWTEWSNRMHLR